MTASATFGACQRWLPCRAVAAKPTAMLDPPRAHAQCMAKGNAQSQRKALMHQRASRFCALLVAAVQCLVQVLAAVRGPIVVLLGVMLFAEFVSVLEFVGYSIALAGFVWYNFAKVAQAATAAPAKPAQ
jgi:hypothetical protein